MIICPIRYIFFIIVLASAFCLVRKKDLPNMSGIEAMIAKG